jgi:hypothetical protein
MQNYKDTNGNVHSLSDEDIIKGGESLLPAGCVKITQKQADAIANPKPTLEQIKAQKVALVQNHLDATAQALNYDDIKTAVTYADEPSVAKFQSEGKALRAWRSLVWEKCYTLLTSNIGDIPSDTDFIAALPEFVPPAG